MGGCFWHDACGQSGDATPETRVGHRDYTNYLQDHKQVKTTKGPTWVRRFSLLSQDLASQFGLVVHEHIAGHANTTAECRAAGA